MTTRPRDELHRELDTAIESAHLCDLEALADATGCAARRYRDVGRVDFAAILTAFYRLLIREWDIRQGQAAAAVDEVVLEFETGDPPW